MTKYNCTVENHNKKQKQNQSDQLESNADASTKKNNVIQ